MSVVWEATVDRGAWRARVTSDNESDGYQGTLTVIHLITGEVVHIETVAITYGARFGPDIDDISAWQARALAIIDGKAEVQPP